MKRNYKNNKGKICGYVLDDNIYRKKVDSTKHKMKIFDAYGIDMKIVNTIISEGIKEIRILETDTGTILSVDVDTFNDNAIIKDFDGKQMFLPVKFFTKSKL